MHWLTPLHNYGGHLGSTYRISSRIISIQWHIHFLKKRKFFTKSFTPSENCLTKERKWKSPKKEWKSLHCLRIRVPSSLPDLTCFYWIRVPSDSDSGCWSGNRGEEKRCVRVYHFPLIPAPLLNCLLNGYPNSPSITTKPTADNFKYLLEEEDMSHNFDDKTKDLDLKALPILEMAKVGVRTTL